MLLNYGVGEDSWESLGLQGDQTVNSKGNQSWIFTGRTDEAEAPIAWPSDAKNWLIWNDPDAGKHWSRRKRGWQRMKWLDGITDSLDMNLSKGSWWWTGKPGVLQSMGSQRVGHNWATELILKAILSSWHYFPTAEQWTWASKTKLYQGLTPGLCTPKA